MITLDIITVAKLSSVHRRTQVYSRDTFKLSVFI